MSISYISFLCIVTITYNSIHITHKLYEFGITLVVASKSNFEFVYFYLMIVSTSALAKSSLLHLHLYMARYIKASTSAESREKSFTIISIYTSKYYYLIYDLSVRSCIILIH